MFAFVVTMLQSYQICGRAPTAFPLSARPEPAARGPFSKKLRHASTAQRGVKKPFVHVFPRFAPRGVKVCCEKTPRRGLAATCSCHACPPLRPRCSFSVGFCPSEKRRKSHISLSFVQKTDVKMRSVAHFSPQNGLRGGKCRPCFGRNIPSNLNSIPWIGASIPWIGAEPP